MRRVATMSYGWWRIGRLAARLLAAAGLLAATAAAVSADEQPAAAAEDWPTIISKLQQEVYRRPGFAQVHQQLATAHNNYGVSLGQQGQWDLAVRELEEAIRINPEVQSFRTNLSQIYLHQAAVQQQRHEIVEALQTLEQAIAVDPNLAPAHALKGEIEYERQRLKEAKAAWQRALELDPSQETLAKRLEQVTGELPVESEFERLPQAYFDLRYEEGLDRPGGFDLQDALLDARRSVGADFAYWPKHKIVVLIYSAESFRALRQETPEWVAGQFDGKIRVPLPGQQLDVASVRRTLHHEYTHALIRDLANSTCPTWLNEGLAEYEGEKGRPGVFPALATASREGRLVPWAQLSAQFSIGKPVGEVQLGYEQAHSIARYLVERYGFWRIRQLLKALAEGRPWEAAFEETFRLKPARLEANWRGWLPSVLGTE